MGLVKRYPSNSQNRLEEVSVNLFVRYPETQFLLEKMISSSFVYALSSIAAIFKFVERLYYEVHVAFNDPIVHGLNQRGE